MLQGKTLNDIVLDYPGYALLNLQKLHHWEQYCQRKRKRDSLTDKIPVFDNRDFSNATGAICRWLNRNIRRPRKFKQPQLWIWSEEPNKGKTTLIRQLDKILSIHYLMKDEPFDDMYEDGTYDLIVIDEFEGQRKLGWMNEMLQGGTMPLRHKGAQYLKRDNLPVLIASNLTPSTCYKNCTTNRLSTLSSRLIVIEVVQFIRITVHKWMDP